MGNPLIKTPWTEAFLVPGYEVKKDGLFVDDPEDEKSQIRLTEAPFWYHSTLVDLDTKEAKIELRYYIEGITHKLFIDRSLFYSQGWLSSLANQYKLPIAPHQQRSISTYLYFADMRCSKIGYTLSHAGWTTLPDGTLEYVPFGSVQPDPESAGIKKRFSFIKSNGDEKKWCDTIFSMLEANPLAVIPFAGSLAAPLLSLLSLPSVVIDVHNTSSSGKTIACSAAMSIWGKPDQLKINWDSTKIALEQNAIAFSDLPLFFDESQLAFPKDVGTSVYNVANGMGRERGAAGGGTRLTGTWSTVLISTGEQSLLSLIPQSFAGLDARIIPVEGKTLQNLDAKGAQSLARVVQNNYGFLAPKYTDHLKRADKAKLFESYTTHLEYIRKLVYPSDVIQMRKSETYAALFVAIDQLLVIYPEYREKIYVLWYSVLSFWQELCKQHSSEQIAHRALSCLLSRCYANVSRFKSDDNAHTERFGTVYKKQFALYPPMFEKLCKEHGFQPENILREFAQRGWLRLNSKGGYKVRTTDSGITKETKQFYSFSDLAVEVYSGTKNMTPDDYEDELIEAWQKGIDAGLPKYEERLVMKDLRFDQE